MAGEQKSHTIPRVVSVAMSTLKVVPTTTAVQLLIILDTLGGTPATADGEVKGACNEYFPANKSHQ